MILTALTWQLTGKKPQLAYLYNNFTWFACILFVVRSVTV